MRWGMLGAGECLRGTVQYFKQGLKRGLPCTKITGVPKTKMITRYRTSAHEKPPARAVWPAAGGHVHREGGSMLAIQWEVGGADVSAQ
jgi:hypothetical protein